MTSDPIREVAYQRAREEAHRALRAGHLRALSSVCASMASFHAVGAVFLPDMESAGRAAEQSAVWQARGTLIALAACDERIGLERIVNAALSIGAAREGS